MEDDTEQASQGEMSDDLMSRGRDMASQAMTDPETGDRITGQVQERLGNVPGANQALGAFGSGGGSTSDQQSGSESGGGYDTSTDASADGEEPGDPGSSQY